MALIKHCFPDLEDAEHRSILHRMLGPKKTEASSAPQCLLPALRLLENEGDAKLFDDLRNQAEDNMRQAYIITRVGVSRSAAEAHTPTVLKVLRPPVRGCILAWQPQDSRFNAYYPRPKTSALDDTVAPTPAEAKHGKKPRLQQQHSTSRSYAGDKWTQLQALMKVLQTLWGWHKKYGGDSCLTMHKYKIVRCLTCSHC